MTREVDWSRLVGRRNALNAIRLALAIIVVISHSLIFQGPGLSVFTIQMGAGAVAGFFGISGYLIAGSRDRIDFLPFIWRRVVRLMPAYWLVLLVTACILAPITATLTGAMIQPSSVAQYLSHNLLLMQRQVNIGDTLRDSPAPNYAYVWNSALWTLPYEFGSYLALGILFQLRPLRSVGANLAAVVACTLLYILAATALLPWLDPNIGRLGAFFGAGSTLYAARNRLGNDARIAAVAAVASAWAIYRGPDALVLVGPFPIAYLLLWVGARYRGGWTERHDVSYGMYVYAFPLQQMLAVKGVSAALGTVANACVSVAVVVPLAIASWKWVEQPALRLRRLVPAGRPVKHPCGGPGRRDSAVAPELSAVVPGTTVIEPPSS